jgi:HEPN domain-containing protein
MTEIGNRRLQYCEEQLVKAQSLYEEIKEAERDGLGGARPSKYISDCQQAIEYAGKTLFWLTGNEPPTEHQISWDNAQEVLRSDWPGPFHRASDVPRVILLTQFWGEFYLTAKYGEENFGTSPDRLFTRSDMKLAVEHAGFCVRVAEALLNAVRTERARD